MIDTAVESRFEIDDVRCINACAGFMIKYQSD